MYIYIHMYIYIYTMIYITYHVCVHIKEICIHIYIYRFPWVYVDQSIIWLPPHASDQPWQVFACRYALATDASLENLSTRDCQSLVLVHPVTTVPLFLKNVDEKCGGLGIVLCICIYTYGSGQYVISKFFGCVLETGIWCQR